MRNNFESPLLRKENRKEGEKDEDLRAIEIATETGDYEKIINQLKNEGLWEKQIMKTRERFNSAIDMENFPTRGETVWEMLTVLYLYDEGTAEHCVETYRLLRKRIEKIATGNLFLAEVLRKENHEMERIYFASLTHDIGKVCIPPFIINNKLSREDWDSLLLEMLRNNELNQTTKERLGIKDEVNYTDDEFLQKLHNSNLQSKEIVPVEKGLSDDEKIKLEEKWNLSGKLPFMEIINRHANFSAEIHERQGLHTTSKLVGQHHAKKENGTELILPERIRVDGDLGDILSLADMEEALESKRSYKEAFSKLRIIKELKEEIKDSNIGKAIEYFWMKDKLNHFLKENNPKSLESLSEFDKQSLLDINNYLKKLRAGNSGKEIENWLDTHLRN